MMRCFWFKFNFVLVIWWDVFGSSMTSFWLYDEMFLVQVRLNSGYMMRCFWFNFILVIWWDAFGSSTTSFWLYDEIFLVKVQLRSGYVMRYFWFKYNFVLVMWWDVVGSSTTSFWLYDEKFLVQVRLRQKCYAPNLTWQVLKPMLKPNLPIMDSTFHVPEMSILTTQPSRTSPSWMFYKKLLSGSISSNFFVTKTMSKILQFNLPVSTLSVWINTTQEGST